MRSISSSGPIIFTYILSPRREMRSISIRGPIVFTYVLLWVSKRTLKKKVIQLEWFWPGFFLEMFYPPKGDTQYLTRGSIDTLSIY